MATYRVKHGKINTPDKEGRMQRYEVGQTFECEPYVVAGLLDLVEPIDPIKEIVLDPPVTKIAHKRSDGFYDVINVVTNLLVSDKPLTAAEAAAVADKFDDTDGWSDALYAPPAPPFKLDKITDALPGTPSFNVIEMATGQPVNAEPLVKAAALALLDEKLKGANA